MRTMTMERALATCCVSLVLLAAGCQRTFKSGDAAIHDNGPMTFEGPRWRVDLAPLDVSRRTVADYRVENPPRSHLILSLAGGPLSADDLAQLRISVVIERNGQRLIAADCAMLHEAGGGYGVAGVSWLDCRDSAGPLLLHVEVCEPAPTAQTLAPQLRGG